MTDANDSSSPVGEASETPETDEMLRIVRDNEPEALDILKCVPANFARSLERKLRESVELNSLHEVNIGLLNKIILDERSRAAELSENDARYRQLHNGEVDGLLIIRARAVDIEDIEDIIDGDELNTLVDASILAARATGEQDDR